MLKRLLPLLLIALVGCGGPLELTVAGEPDLNSGGNAAVVRIYQLNSQASFMNTTLARFWQDDRAALGAQYVDHRQLLLYPGQSETIPIEVSDETLYIGIAADLREPDRDQWRQVFSVDELNGEDVTISVGAHALSVRVD